MSLGEDDRAVSVAVSQTLSIGVATLLITGLIFGGSTLFEDQKQRVAESGLENVGSSVMSDLTRLDAYNTSAIDNNITFRAPKPDRLGGVSYDINFTTIDVSGDARGVLFLEAQEAERSVSIQFENSTNICESRLSGGNLLIEYDANEDCLRLRRDR